jgi:Flp pilus assembly pilin Flp
MSKLLSALWRDESGQDLTEYVLLIVIIALGVTVAIVALRDELINVFNEASTELQSY